MSTSKHVYAAYLVGSPDVPLEVKGGRITLDSSGTPHVQADITIAIPEEDVLVELDYRISPRPRVRIEAVAEFSSGEEQDRTFDLVITDRDVQHRSGEVGLTLTSDESLLEDIAQLEDDDTPQSLESSLRAVINYVLDYVIPGAELEAEPAVDADVTSFWELTNRVLDPTALNTSSFTVGASSTGLATTATNPWHGSTAIRWESTSTAESYLKVSVDGAVSAGDEITVSAYMRAGGAGRSGRLLIRWRNDAGVTIRNDLSAPVSLPVNPDWERLNHTARAPRGAGSFEFYVIGVPTTTGDAFAVDGLMATDGRYLVDWFYGTQPADDFYTYAWTDAPHVSQSVRTPVLYRDPESLVWRAGVPAIDFLLPLFQAAGFRLVCDENRKWTLRDETYTADGVLSFKHAVNLTDATDSIRRDSGLWMDARVTRYTWTDRYGIEQTVIDSYAMTDPPTRVTLLEIDSPYPGPGRSAYAVRRAQGLGREVTVAKISDWRAQADMIAVAELDRSPIQTGRARRIEFNLDNDEITAQIRTIELPLGSIALLTGTIGDLAGTIADL